MHRATLLLLLLLCVPSAYGATIYVNQHTGNDSHPCAQAQTQATAKRSINAGIACLAAGDTLLIGPGNYDELLTSQQSSSRGCTSTDAAAQPGCAQIPNGISETQKTTLTATGTESVVSPVGRQWPGGGSAINLYDYARYIQIEGLRVVKHSAPGSIGGIYSGNAQYITLKGNTLDNGQIKAGVTSRFMQVIGNHVFNTGKDVCPVGVKPTPAGCPHGMYLCGTDHVISDNYVHDTSYYGIQISCEQGGIARIRLERNRVERSPVVGIRCAGQDCFLGANVLVANGTGITVSGSGTITNNTIHDWYHPADQWGQDPWGIYGDLGGFTITNNLLTAMKSSFLAISNNLAAPNPERVHHNMCETSGNTGCTLLASASLIYREASSGNLTLRSDSPAIGVGVAGGAATDLTGTPYVTPDLGAYAAGSPPLYRPGHPPVEPPDPPVPPTPGGWALACTGDLLASGKLALRCTPEAAR
jgi:hypothetical protein